MPGCGERSLEVEPWAVATCEKDSWGSTVLVGRGGGVKRKLFMGMGLVKMILPPSACRLPILLGLVSGLGQEGWCPLVAHL